jgi:hypothetical protein
MLSTLVAIVLTSLYLSAGLMVNMVAAWFGLYSDSMRQLAHYHDGKQMDSQERIVAAFVISSWPVFLAIAAALGTVWMIGQGAKLTIDRSVVPVIRHRQAYITREKQLAAGMKAVSRELMEDEYHARS